MTCACKQIVRDPATTRAIEVAGTWDYKWPLGTAIRVAFQTPPADVPLGAGALDAIRTVVIDLANRWGEAVKKFLPADASSVWNETGARQSTGVGFDFKPGWFLPPLGDAEIARGTRHNSPFLRPAGKSDDGPSYLRDYDVLISFEDLPLERFDPVRSSSAGIERVTLPLTELGSYARRADFGAPTAYLGRFGKAVTGGLTLRQHLETEIGQHVVVHEFGHILGLGHEHQNPLYKDRKYLDPLVIARKVQRAYGLTADVTQEEVETQIIKTWPGNTNFSDWRSPVGELRALDSVMTFPGHQHLLAGAAQANTDELPSFKFNSLPTKTDIDNLAHLYTVR